MKAIQEELGEKDDVNSEYGEYVAKIHKLAYRRGSREASKEAERLTKMQYHSPEGTVIRTYLDTCLELPWNKTTKDRSNINREENLTATITDLPR